MSHFLTITTSGILKKLFNGEKLNFFIFKLRIEDNFDLADQFLQCSRYFKLYINSFNLIAYFCSFVSSNIFERKHLEKND